MHAAICVRLVAYGIISCQDVDTISKTYPLAKKKGSLLNCMSAVSVLMHRDNSDRAVRRLSIVKNLGDLINVNKVTNRVFRRILKKTF